MNFEKLHLIEPLVRAVHGEGYTRATPIQQQAIPEVLAKRDVLGCAQTGTGKTAAFALPILQRLHTEPHERTHRHIRALILTPTRELASQIDDSFKAYGRHLHLRSVVIFGGVGQNAQTLALKKGVDILVATPGRLLDLMQQGFVDLKRLEIFVLDEADRMLDMGFIHDVRKVIAALPKERQTLFFSATMPPDIQALADAILRDPARVAVVPESTVAERIAQTLYFVEKADKRQLLVQVLAADKTMSRVLVFSRTKHGANRIAEHLSKNGIHADAIHGNKSQNARERALESFKRGKSRVLVATDIAARGIDVDNVTHVVNFDLPDVPETYVHRIGRTARAGAEGAAIAFCEADDRENLRAIERVMQQHIPVVRAHAFASSLPPPAATDLSAKRGQHVAPQGRGGPARGAQGRGHHPHPHASRDRSPSEPHGARSTSQGSHRAGPAVRPEGAEGAPRRRRRRRRPARPGSGHHS